MIKKSGFLNTDIYCLFVLHLLRKLNVIYKLNVNLFEMSIDQRIIIYTFLGIDRIQGTCAFCLSQRWEFPTHNDAT